MRGAGSKNAWALFLLILAGIVLGGFIGCILQKGFQHLAGFSYGQTFGVETPIVLNLGLVVITFGLTIKITIASIIGVDYLHIHLSFLIGCIKHPIYKGGGVWCESTNPAKDESKNTIREMLSEERPYENVNALGRAV